MSPVVLQQVIRPTPWIGTLAARVTNALLLTPVFGAFFQTLFTHRVPSLGWTFLLLGAAFVTRVLRTRSLVRERPALLGEDGLLVDGRFVGVTEISRVERDDAALWITTRSGERLELRADPDAIACASRVAEAIGRSSAPPARRDVAGEQLLAALGEREVADGAAYRGLPLDEARCLAIAEDVAAAPEARIAAARRLAQHADGGVRARVGELALATVNPELRDALLEAAEPRSLTR